MSEYTVKASRLSFKGDRKARKKRRNAEDEETGEPAGDGSAQGRTSTLAPATGWILATGATDIQGPVHILFNSDPPCCLAVSEKDGAVPVLEPIECEITASEPANVNQVFVAAPFPGTTAGTIALRTADGHFLGTDRVGVVSCQRQAASAPEEWLPLLREDGWALQNVAYQTFLAVDEDGGSTLRCDGDTVGFRQVFRIKCQAEVVQKSRKETKKKEREAGELELDQLRRYQSWNSVRRTDAGDVRELKKAKREGKLNEAMLDRREKLKSDKFCK